MRVADVAGSAQYARIAKMRRVMGRTSRLTFTTSLRRGASGGGIDSLTRAVSR